LIANKYKPGVKVAGEKSAASLLINQRRKEVLMLSDALSPLDKSQSTILTVRQGGFLAVPISRGMIRFQI